MNENQETTVEEQAEKVVEAIKESVPEEKQEELLTEIQKLMQMDFQRNLLDELARQKRLAVMNMFRQPTAQHGDKLRGVGITRKSKEGKKDAVKLAKKQRATNQKRSNKKSRPTGSKKRK